jgi:catechol 2,3-dioxygenase-like lactoylglutathione lyase family enzyme
LNRITDIALFVSDLPRAIAFYRDLMELELKRLDTGFAEFWMEGAILAVGGGGCRAPSTSPARRGADPP